MELISGMKLKVEKFENWVGNQESIVFLCYLKIKIDLEEVICVVKKYNVVICCVGICYSWVFVFVDDYIICVNIRDFKDGYEKGEKI